MLCLSYIRNKTDVGVLTFVKISKARSLACSPTALPNDWLLAPFFWLGKIEISILTITLPIGLRLKVHCSHFICWESIQD